MKDLTVPQIPNFDAATINKAVHTYGFLMKKVNTINGKKLVARLSDGLSAYSLGDLANAIRTKIHNKDVIVKEMCETLRKYKGEFVSLV